MKTCRFCMHEQETGDYCEACGSPFPADKVDFSDLAGDSSAMGGAFADPTAQTFPDPTVQAFPDPTAQAFPDPTAQAFPDPTAQGAGTVMAGFGGVAASQQDAPAAQQTPDVTAPIMQQATDSATQNQQTPNAAAKNRKQPQTEKPSQKELFEKPGQRKIMYSAAANHETVYKNGKLSGGGWSTTPSTPVQPGPGWWNGAPNATPVTSPKTPYQVSTTPSETTSGQVAPTGQIPVQNTPSVEQVVQSAQAAPSALEEAFRPYSAQYNHTLITVGLSAVGLLCCCGMSIPSLILSSLAHAKLSGIKKGTSSEDPKKAAGTAKIMTLVADYLLAVCALIMFFIIITSD